MTLLHRCTDTRNSVESGGKDVHPVAGHDMNGSHNKDAWTVYKQMNGIQCRRLAEMYEMIGI